MRALVVLATVLFLMIVAVTKPQIGLFAWGWLTMMQPHQAAFAIEDLRLNLIVALVTIVAWVLSREPKKPVPDATSGLFILFILWMVVCQIFSLRSEYSWTYFDRFIRVMIFIFLCAVMLNTKARVHAMIWIVCISIGLYAVKGGIFTVGTGGSYRVWGPLNTVIADNNHVGAAFVVILPLLNYLRLQTEAWLIRLGLLGTMLLTLFAILGTHSRGALIGLAAVALVLWWRSRRRFVVLLIALPVVVGGLALMPDSWVQRMETIQEAGEDSSFQGRLEAWQIAIEIAKGNPLTGGGFRVAYLQDIANAYASASLTSRATHSIYFEILGSMGFVGLALFLSLLGLAFRNALKISAQAQNVPELAWARDFAFMAQAGLIGYCVSGAALSIEFWEGGWLLIVLLSRVKWQVEAICSRSVKTRQLGPPVAHELSHQRAAGE